ncbi:MAG TPA: O-antigen ligase family protein [Deltaproteobacteria bacterium]|nr:O-antigen ligase family protein [Deltaproteobacteria bacterium]
MTDIRNIDHYSYKILIILVCLSFFAFAIGTAPLSIASLSALGVWLLSGICYRDRQAWISQQWLVPLVLLIMLPWFGMLWSDAPMHKLNFAQRSHFWLFALVAATTIRTEQVLNKVVVCYIAGMVFTALPILLYSFSLTPSMYFMTKIAAQGYITYSLLIVIAIALLAFFYREATDLKSRFLIFSLIMLLVLTVTQLSGRSGYISLALLSPWIFLKMFGRRRLLPILAAMTIVLALLASSQKVRDRLALIPQEAARYEAGDRTETSVGARIQMLKDGWTVFMRHPLAGAGTAGLWHETNLMRPGHGISHPHNSYLYVAANYGLIGIGLYAWLFFITIRRAWHARDSLAGHTILAFVSVIMIGSLTDTQILSMATGIALGFIVGIPTTDDKQCAS